MINVVIIFSDSYTSLLPRTGTVLHRSWTEIVDPSHSPIWEIWARFLGPVFWARFLSLSHNMLSNCHRQDRSETVLWSLTVSVFRLCLRQTIVVRIQVQVLNRSTLIKYFFWKRPYFNKILYSNYAFLYNQIIAVQINTWLFSFVCCRTTNFIFLNVVWRHLRYFGDTHRIVSERAKTVPSHGVRCLGAAYDPCC